MRALRLARAAAALIIVVAPAAWSAGPGDVPRPGSGQGLQGAQRSFTVGTATAHRGQRAYGVLKVPAGSDAG